MERLVSSAFAAGDDLTLNAGSPRPRVQPDGTVRCSHCDRHLDPSAFGVQSQRGTTAMRLESWCTACKVAGKRRTAPAHNVVHLPRAKPPATDSGRQLRTLLDDLGRTLSRLDSLAARSAPDQFGDEIERRTLASQLSRLATTAIEMTGRLSGIVTTEESDHDRRARVRSIR